MAYCVVFSVSLEIFAVDKYSDKWSCIEQSDKHMEHDQIGGWLWNSAAIQNCYAIENGPKTME